MVSLCAKFWFSFIIWAEIKANKSFPTRETHYLITCAHSVLPFIILFIVYAHSIIITCAHSDLPFIDPFITCEHSDLPFIVMLITYAQEAVWPSG